MRGPDMYDSGERQDEQSSAHYRPQPDQPMRGPDMFNRGERQDETYGPRRNTTMTGGPRRHTPLGELEQGDRYKEENGVRLGVGRREREEQEDYSVNPDIMVRYDVADMWKNRLIKLAMWKDHLSADHLSFTTLMELEKKVVKSV